MTKGEGLDREIASPAVRRVAVIGLAVLFVGVVVASIFMRPRRHSSSNSTAATATLRNLASVQKQFREAGSVDVDGDGIGEFGTFGELTAASGPRLTATGDRRGEGAARAVLSPSLANVHRDGFVLKAGYRYRIFLPAASGGAVHESLPGQPFAAPVATDAAEQHWCAFAWPEENGVTAVGVFFVDEKGDVWRTENSVARYGGAKAPSFDASRPPSADPWTSTPRDGVPARDGEIWTRVK
jgi:hypothetical protein